MTEEATISSTLGLDLAQDYAMPDSLFDSALQVAFDPDTVDSDPSVVPEMDDDVVDYGDDVIVPESVDHGDHAPGEHIVEDHGIGDGDGDDGAYDDDGVTLDPPSHDAAPHDVDDAHPADHWHDDHHWHG
ncbi:hypothetical protein ACNHUS_25540 [Actinomycetes bacterium M1A6_2h]